MVGHLHGEPINLINQAVFHKQCLREEIGVPPVVVLMLGTNDLCQDVLRRPEEVARDLISLAMFFRNEGVARVMVVEVLPRFGRNAFRRLDPFTWIPGLYTIPDLEREFQLRVARFNKQLREAVWVNQGLTYLNLTGLHKHIRRWLPDGLHLCPHGRNKLRKALRKAVIVDLLRSRMLAF